jgi:hypothetical protein
MTCPRTDFACRLIRGSGHGAERLVPFEAQLKNMPVQTGWP